MSKMKLTPSTPGTDSGSQTLFDQFGAVQTVMDGIATSSLPAAEQAALDAQLQTYLSSVQAQIAANIQTATPAGQAFPDVVIALDGSAWLIDTATGVPKLDVAIVVNASDIPLAATPPAPAASPGS